MLKTLLAGLALAAATFMAGSASAQDTGKAWDPKITDTDYVLGKADAPVTMLEFASFTCPHCAAFSNDVLPQIEKAYVDTGKVKIVFRQFPLNGLDLRAGMMARCAPREQYFNIAKVLFQTQQSWAMASDPIGALAQIGGMAGLPKDKFDACLADNSVADGIVNGMQAAQTEYQVDATPTFVIEGEKVAGENSFDSFKAIFDRKLAEKGVATN
ncbi:DsbA family protein [Inquilinus sp. Marseille-Q2685]|uniref:DsbA family protein n=1 Tax=Inquilinus sp. Marseille-Q2685 TaxID=2866581 RepID=UPI001CE406CB|nr:DsbA family protein [Inquilinus sp. Marseille-Q2685]